MIQRECINYTYMETAKESVPPANWQKAVKGLVLLAAVIFDVVSKRGGKLIAKN